MSQTAQTECVEGPRRKRPVIGTYDVIVAGAGLAGVSAATAAARAGAKVAIVELQPFAGGVSTASMEPSMCNYFHNTRQELIVGGRPLELVERMVNLGAVSRNWNKHRGHIVFDVEIGKLAMDEMLEDAGVDVFYDTLVTDVIVRDNRLQGLYVANRSGDQAVMAKCVVDATGDADVAAYAGAPLHVGPEQSNRHSFVFRLGNVDLDSTVHYLKDNPSEYMTGSDIALTFEEAMDFYEDTGILYFHHGATARMKVIRGPVDRGEYPKEWGPFVGMNAFQMHGIRWNRTMVVNTGFFQMHEPTGERISHFLRQGRKLAHHVADFMKGTFPGCKDSFVVSTAIYPGIRRTRWLKADFTLTREIYDSAPSYSDAVGQGVLIQNGPLYVTDRTFDIPLRCLIPQRVEGLVVGSGRSASGVPAEMLRTMPVTMIVGQGAGVVAAISVRDGATQRDVNVEAVQEELRRQGANLG